MGVFTYLIYALCAFIVYMAYMLNFQLFLEVVVPWVVFIAILFAPLVYTAHRAEKEIKK